MLSFFPAINLYMQEYMYVYWVVIKMYHCSSWSKKFEFRWFRRQVKFLCNGESSLPFVQSTVAGVSSREEVKVTLTKISILGASCL